MLKAVIFDLDGLLVDSTPLHREADHAFIESFNKVHYKSQGGREGMRIIDIIRDYKDIYDLPGNVEDLYALRQQKFLELAKQKLTLFPGVMELLQKLKQRKLKIGLATSGDRDYVRLVFNKFPDFKDTFDKAVTSEDVERGKPYPDCYLKILEKLQVKPDEAVVLEDSFNGIAAAKNAGIKVIAIPNKHYQEADYSNADIIFNDLSEAENAIK